MAAPIVLGLIATLGLALCSRETTTGRRSAHGVGLDLESPTHIALAVHIVIFARPYRYFGFRGSAEPGEFVWNAPARELRDHAH